MDVLTVYANSNPKSFCHAVLDQFTAGLREAGHSSEVVDLYAIGFDPVHRPATRQAGSPRTSPDDLLDRMHIRESVLEGAGGPLRRFAMKRLLGDRDDRGIIRLLRERYQPKDVLAQQEKVARAPGTCVHCASPFLELPGHLERVV